MAQTSNPGVVSSNPGGDGQKFILKKILLWRILISSYFEPLEVWMVVCFANYFLFKSIWAPCDPLSFQNLIIFIPPI